MIKISLIGLVNRAKALAEQTRSLGVAQIFSTSLAVSTTKTVLVTSVSRLVLAVQSLTTTAAVTTGKFFAFLFRENTEQVSTVDSISVTTNKTITENQATTDSIATVVAWSRTQQDQVLATDDYLGIANVDDDQFNLVGKAVQDVTSALDTTKVQATKTVTDTEVVGDTSFVLLSPTLTETIGLTEVVQTQSGFNKLFQDTYSAVEDLSLQTNKTVQDSSTLSATITVLSENYFEADYTVTGASYAGTIIINEAG